MDQVRLRTVAMLACVVFVAAACDSELAEMLLLARFANATWKAGQPFRSLARITRPNFIPAAMLTDEELQKDFDQIKAAAGKLLEAMNRK